MSNTPDVDSAAAAVAVQGERVLQHLRALIAAAPEAMISFADCMRAMLYAPGLGYYAAGSTKLGAAGDFVTAPELSPLFGATLGRLFAPLAEGGRLSVLELGAGSGKLAVDFLAAQPEADYRILEVSADLRARQGERLQGRAVRWLDALPERIEGLVIANEVLDAVPCELVRYQGGRYEQGCVRWNDGAAALDWVWRPLPAGDLLTACEARVPPIEGYTSEINLEAEALVASLSERLDDGALCFIDYGFPRSQYYLPERRGGTLACHFRQQVNYDPLLRPGLQDVTAHVDFTAMAEAAVDAGAAMLCYSSQAAFLLHGGVLDLLQAQPFADDKSRIVATGAVQKLLLPTEMGELFKVMVVGKGAALERLAGLATIDQSFRL